jgi:hypothetical protein
VAFEQRDMSGSLWPNEHREKDTHPHRTGSAMIDGVEYWVNGWVKESNGKKWLSLAFKRKDAKPAAGKAQKPAPSAKDDFDDDLTW